MTEFRDLRGAVRAAGDGRTITVRALTYGVVDDYGSLWKPGAITEAARKRLPILCWAHDWAEPIGKATEFRDGADGPIFRCRVSDPDDVPRARQALSQLTDGTVTDVSVGFSVPTGGRRDPTEAEAKRHPGIREVIERAAVEELSIVIRGAVPGAQVLAMRSTPRTSHETRRLARLYADGRITRSQYREAMDLEGQMQRALDLALAVELDQAERAVRYHELRSAGFSVAEARRIARYS